MRTIWKFPLNMSYETVINAPLGASFRHVDRDPTGKLCVWMEVETLNSSIPKTIYVIGTGHLVPPHSNYLASIVDGSFVWHLYEVSQ